MNRLLMAERRKARRCEEAPSVVDSGLAQALALVGAVLTIVRFLPGGASRES